MIRLSLENHNPVMPTIERVIQQRIGELSRKDRCSQSTTHFLEETLKEKAENTPSYG